MPPVQFVEVLPSPHDADAASDAVQFVEVLPHVLEQRTETEAGAHAVADAAADIDELTFEPIEFEEVVAEFREMEFVQIQPTDHSRWPEH